MSKKKKKKKTRLALRIDLPLVIKTLSSPKPCPLAFTTTSILPMSFISNTSLGSRISLFTTLPPRYTNRFNIQEQYTMGFTHHVSYSIPNATLSSGTSPLPNTLNPSTPRLFAQPGPLAFTSSKYSGPGFSRYSIPFINVIPASGLALHNTFMRWKVASASWWSRLSVSLPGAGGTQRLCAPPQGEVKLICFWASMRPKGWGKSLARMVTVWPADWSSRALERPITPALNERCEYLSCRVSALCVSFFVFLPYPMTIICEGILMVRGGELMAEQPLGGDKAARDFDGTTKRCQKKHPNS